MPIEREPIESIPTQTSTNTPIMRDERVLEPYRLRNLKPTPQEEPKSGQTDTRKGQESTPTEDTVKLSPQAALIARKELKFRQQQQELEKEKAQLAAEKTELAQLRAMKEKLAAKDYSALEGMVDYNDYSQYQVNKLNGTDPVQEELKKIGTEVTELKKSQQDQIHKQFEAAVQERRVAVTSLVEKNPEFAGIKKAKAEEHVVKHILDTWEHDSKELSIEQAAKEVQEMILEQAKQWASLLEEEKTESAPPVDKKQPLPPMKSQGLKTLTNQVTAGDGTRKKPNYSAMNDAERWAAARQVAEERLRNMPPRP